MGGAARYPARAPRRGTTGAQDIEANYFWESMGFLPIAFRAGSDKKKGVHIFWQRRINAEDVTTPFWFPAKTESGAIREDRLVLPIPPGLSWRDEMPVLVPAASAVEGPQAQLPAVNEVKRSSKMPKPQNMPPQPSRRRPLQFGPPPAHPVVEAPVTVAPAKKPPREKVKIDPQTVAKARELRDRYLEHVNSAASLPPAQGKYDVSRVLEVQERRMPLLKAG